MPSESVDQNGERIIRGSMRPDGTFRKDVRVKAGYVPQDEQKTYDSKDALVSSSFCELPPFLPLIVYCMKTMQGFQQMKF